ncbi:MAG: hypothetical protein ACLFTK_05905, partial [Anaerolineales bacterium]
DGYPDIARAWTGDLLERWNLALDAAHNRLPGVALNAWDDIAEAGNATSDTARLIFFARLFYNREASPEEIAPAADVDDARDQLALLLAGPAFQWK